MTLKSTKKTLIFEELNVVCRPYFTLLLIYLILIGSNSFTLQAQQIKFVKYTAEDGLPSSNIYQVIQDKSGFIWISTDKGVARFDGYEFKNFIIQDGLPSNDIWGLREDEARRIWFATFNQLAYYQDGHIINLPFSDSNGFSTPMVIANWTGDKDFVYTLVREKNINYLLEINVQTQGQNLLSSNFDHLGFLGKKEGKSWFYSINRHQKPKIYFIQDGKKTNYKTLEVHNHHLLSRKFVQGKEKVYFFTPHQIIEFDYQTFKTIPITAIFGKDTLIEDVFPGNSTHQQLILLKTNLGYKIVNEQLNPLNLLGQSDIFYKSILEDRNGNIWLAAADGLYLLTSNARFSQFYALSDGSKSNKCTALLIEDDQTIWAGNQKNEVWKIKGKNKTYITLKQNDYTNVPITHLSKWQNNLVAAGDFGIFLLPPNRLKQAVIHAQLFKRKEHHPLKFYEDSGNFLPYPIKSITENENCLLLSQWSGVSLLEQENKILKKTNLEKSRTYASVSDKKGKIWMGTKDGLWYLEKEKLIHAGKEHPSLKYPINDLKIDHNGHLWLATDGYGILYFDGQLVAEIAESKNAIPKQLFIDINNQLWAATNRGIAKINLKNTTPFSYNYQQITTAHGLASSEVNQVIVKDSIIYAATNGGLTLIDYKKDFSTLPPILSIEKILINGEKVKQVNSYDLSYQENSLKIQYVCLSYESRKQINYQYQMSNIDTTWQNTNALIREYQQLIPGNYTFRLKAADIDGNLSKEQTITFRIHPPWWETTWFKTVAGMLFFSFIAILFQVRVQAIKRKEASKTKINKKFAELELQALQAQMNPHFIFNSMNAIQNFIYIREKKLLENISLNFLG